MKLKGDGGSWYSTSSRVLLAVVVVLSVISFLPSRATALSINRREPVTEQVLIITTPASETETPQQDEQEGATSTIVPGVNPNLLMLESEQSDQAVGGDATTTVDTIIVQDVTGESWEVDPTASSIISKDVEIEIATSENTNRLSDNQNDEANSKPILPEIYSFHIESDIKYRYSRTYITSRVANKDLKRAQEVTFSVVLPETAFISKFIMEIDGTPYEAYVKEKEEAKKDYTQAQSQGQSAGLVEKSTRNSNVFNVNVNIKPESKVTFNLTYEELLTRRLGRYEQAININPDQVSSIKDYQIVVNIEESRNLTFLRVPSLSNDVDSQNPDGNNPDAVIERPAPNKAKISWSPTTADQKKLVKEGISGKFLVQYDVDRQADAGQILVMEGYFVHFFAPENLPPLRKHVVFILDISGSMWGRKMEQLKESQTKILDDLSQDDYFNIITFSSDVYLWSPKDVLDKRGNEFRQPSFPAMSEITPPELLARKQPLPATPENINKAKAFIDSLVASGGTNIHDAIIEALNLTAAIKEAQQKAHGGGAASSTEPAAIETTLLPSSTTTAATTTAGSTAAASKSSSASTTTTTTTTTSTTTEVGIDYNDEDRTVVIIDIAKSDLDLMTERPEESTAVSDSSTASPGQVILPANVQSLIIFLTDGEPTVGITDPPEIQKLIRSANQNLSIPIFSLGFGEGADFPFLKKLSLQNNGFGRKIYEASDAALQLKGFYNEIASPLLSNVTFNYTSADFNVTDVTVTRFPTIFGGTEIAVAGKLVAPPKPGKFDEIVEDGVTTLAPSQDEPESTTLQPSERSEDDLDYNDDSNAPNEPSRLSISCSFEHSDRTYFDVNVEGIGRDGEVDLSHVEVFERPSRCGPGIDFPIFFQPPAGSQFPPRPTPPPSQEDIFLERLWAYLTIQQLIEKDLAGVEDSSSAGDANPTDNSIDYDNTINPSSTLPPDDSTQVTKVLPNLDSSASTTSAPSIKRNSTRPETSKERALRLALKYGFVTPLTSLVVVKPNSSDVTNAVPTDGRPDALDSLYAARKMSFQAPIISLGRSARIHLSIPTTPPPGASMMAKTSPYQHSVRVIGGGPFPQRIGGYPMSNKGLSAGYQPQSIRFRSGGGTNRRGSLKKANPYAPQSMSVLALAAPAFPSGIRNKIAYSPLPLPISSNYQFASRPIPLVGGHTNNYPPPPQSLGFGNAAPGYGNNNFMVGGAPDSYDYDSSAESKPNPSPSFPQDYVRPSLISTPATSTTTGPQATSTTSSSLTLQDIIWLPQNDQLLVNQTNYLIARNQTSDDNEGYNCANSQGHCRHLQSCVLAAFTNDESLFRSSYFCGIQSTSSSSNSYVGVCCPSPTARYLDTYDDIDEP